MRKVAVFTGNRAEYGLLFPILTAIHNHPELSLQLYVGGDHVRLGTVSEIRADGLPIHRILEPVSELGNGAKPGDASAVMSLTSASVLRQLQTAFTESPPDWLFVLGDRYETFAAALAGFYHGLPIAHLGGGDQTGGGCVDDTLRFMLSQLAHLHFVMSEDSGRRLIERGEEPWRVTVTGSPVIDNLRNAKLTPREELCCAVGFNPAEPVVLFTQHPIPAEGEATVRHFQQSLEALAELGIQVIATEPNRDGFEAGFSALIAHSRASHPNIHWESSLGREKYLSWLVACDVVAGNSSSGLIETPFFGKPSVTIGPRQSGRLRADNVLEVPYGLPPVRDGLLKALRDKAFIDRARNCANPFGSDPCAPKICERLVTVALDETLLRKHRPVLPELSPR